jgi:hypothetical protein
LGLSDGLRREGMSIYPYKNCIGEGGKRTVVVGLEVDLMTHGVARVERAREPAEVEA